MFYMYSLLSYLGWGVSVVAMSSLCTSLAHVSMERVRVQHVALSFNPHSHFLTPTHTQTHTRTYTHISEGSHQFSRPPAPRSLQPCTSPLGICLFRRSYVDQAVTSSVAGQDGKALLLLQLHLMSISSMSEFISPHWESSHVAMAF